MTLGKLAEVLKCFEFVTLFQKGGFSMDSSPNATTEATFTPDGQYVLSGTAAIQRQPVNLNS